MIHTLDGNPDLLMTLDRTKISSVGMPAMGKFLEKLQVYKSIGDYESGKKMFDSYSQFDETWIKWREIIIAKQKPKRAVVQANSFIEGTVRDYDCFNFSCMFLNPNIFSKFEF